MDRTEGSTTTDREITVEELGEDVGAIAAAILATERGRVSMLRRVNGVRMRVIIEVA